MQTVVTGVTMKRHVFSATILVAAVLLPAVVVGQGSQEEAWGPGTTLSVFGGAAASDSRVSGTASASLGWEFTRYFAIEGNATWLSEPGSGFAALLGPRVALPGLRNLMPSLFAGVGMWMESRPEQVGNQRVEKIFEDMAFATGAGVDVFLSHRLAIRPDVRVMFIRAESNTRVVPVFGVHLTYHFEPHPYLEAGR